MTGLSMTAKWRVDGRDTTPDGYRDNLLYLGDSLRQAWAAWRAARREGMEVSLTRAGTAQALLDGVAHRCEYDDPNQCGWPGHRR